MVLGDILLLHCDVMQGFISRKKTCNYRLLLKKNLEKKRFEEHFYTVIYTLYMLFSLCVFL